MRRVWRPPTDVYETESEIVVKVEVAGMREQDFEIAFVDRRLVIQGRRHDPEGKIIYQNMEIRYGDFYTAVQINLPLDSAAIEATYREGFLYVHLPKAQEHRVHVNVAPAEASGHAR
jgi:HSP20 family protein